MKAADVMVRQVITIRSESTVRDAAALMVANHISALPVTDGQGKLLGIISEGDLLRRSETGTERRRSWWLTAFVSNETLITEFLKANSRRVGDVMTRNVIVARPDTPLQEIATLLEQYRIKRLPIVQNDKVVGIVSRANLVQALASWRDESSRPIPDDAALCAAVMAKLENEPWVSTTLINVTARSGVIDLWGIVETEAQKDAIRVAAEVTPGVTAVNDNITIQPQLAAGYV